MVISLALQVLRLNRNGKTMNGKNGDGVMCTTCGRRIYRSFSDIERELDRLIERMKTNEGGK